MAPAQAPCQAVKGAMNQQNSPQGHGKEKIRKQRSQMTGIRLPQPLFLPVQSRSGDKPFVTRQHVRVMCPT